MRNSPKDLRGALNLLINHRAILADRLLLELQHSDDGTAFVLSHPLDSVDRGRSSEVAAGLVSRLIRDILVSDDCLLGVDFALNRNSPHALYEAFFEVPVRFQQGRNALVLRPESLAWPTSQGNLQLFAFIEQYFTQALDRLQVTSESEALSALRAAVVHNAASGEFSAAAAAARAQLSLRAAQRLAAHHGQSLTGLIDDVRESSAREFLADPTIAVETVATLVGYSDDRAFRRAFKRWTTMSPSDFRRTLKSKN